MKRTRKTVTHACPMKIQRYKARGAPWYFLIAGEPITVCRTPIIFPHDMGGVRLVRRKV